MNAVTQLSVDSAAAGEAARLRANLESRGLMIGPYDILLAGQSLVARLTFVTANTAEFSRVPGLMIENWQLPPKSTT